MDTQTHLRELVDSYLDSQLIEEITIRQGLQDITTAADEHQRYLSTGRLTVTINLASR